MFFYILFFEGGGSTPPLIEVLEYYFQKGALLGQKAAINLWYVDTRPNSQKLFPSIWRSVKFGYRLKNKTSSRYNSDPNPPLNTPMLKDSTNLQFILWPLMTLFTWNG